MHKIPLDLTMAWYPHTLQTGLFSDGIWNTISWIAFFFKLASLAFVVPIMGLIVFDFCLWLWRLNQPQPKDEPIRISRKSTEKRRSRNLASPNSARSTTALASDPSASQRRTIRSGPAYD